MPSQLEELRKLLKAEADRILEGCGNPHNRRRHKHRKPKGDVARLCGQPLVSEEARKFVENAETGQVATTTAKQRRAAKRERRSHRLPGQRRLYVIGAPDFAVKIGVATDPRKRIRELQTGCPVPLEIYYWAPCPRGRELALEGLCHDELSAYRKAGEWFAVSPKVAIDVVERVIFKAFHGNTGSRFKGVHYDEASGLWVADLFSGKDRHTASAKTEEMAAQAYDFIAEKVHKRHALTNRMLGRLEPVCV